MQSAARLTHIQIYNSMRQDPTLKEYLNSDLIDVEIVARCANNILSYLKIHGAEASCQGEMSNRTFTLKVNPKDVKLFADEWRSDISYAKRDLERNKLLSKVICKVFEKYFQIEIKLSPMYSSIKTKTVRKILCKLEKTGESLHLSDSRRPSSLPLLAPKTYYGREKNYQASHYALVSNFKLLKCSWKEDNIHLR